MKEKVMFFFRFLVLFFCCGFFTSPFSDFCFPVFIFFIFISCCCCKLTVMHDEAINANSLEMWLVLFAAEQKCRSNLDQKKGIIDLPIPKPCGNYAAMVSECILSRNEGVHGAWWRVVRDGHPEV